MLISWYLLPRKLSGKVSMLNSAPRCIKAVLHVSHRPLSDVQPIEKLFGDWFDTLRLMSVPTSTLQLHYIGVCWLRAWFTRSPRKKMPLPGSSYMRGRWSKCKSCCSPPPPSCERERTAQDKWQLWLFAQFARRIAVTQIVSCLSEKEDDLIATRYAFRLLCWLTTLVTCREVEAGAASRVSNRSNKL